MKLLSHAAFDLIMKLLIVGAVKTMNKCPSAFTVSYARLWATSIKIKARTVLALKSKRK